MHHYHKRNNSRSFLHPNSHCGPSLHKGYNTAIRWNSLHLSSIPKAALENCRRRIYPGRPTKCHKLWQMIRCHFFDNWRAKVLNLEDDVVPLVTLSTRPSQFRRSSFLNIITVLAFSAIFSLSQSCQQVISIDSEITQCSQDETDCLQMYAKVMKLNPLYRERRCGGPFWLLPKGMNMYFVHKRIKCCSKESMRKRSMS